MSNSLILKENDNLNFILKIVSIISMFAMGLIFGVMPNYIQSCKQSPTFLGLSNSFAGGLFLGIGLFHILPESAEKFEDNEKLKGIPIAYFLAFLSYALILFVEKVISNSHSLFHNDNHHHNENDENEIRREPLIRDSNSNEENEKNGNDIKENEDNNEIENEHHTVSSGFTPYVLLLALSFHGIFEGIALGLRSEVKGTLTLLFAIAAHKWAAALTLGISFVKIGTPNKKFLILIIIFALIGPIGMIIGLILSTTTNELIEGVFLAISTGTFIYIACSEVIVEEFESGGNKIWKFVLFIVGGVLAASLSFLELLTGGHDHEHEGLFLKIFCNFIKGFL